MVARFLGSKFLLWTQGALRAWTEAAAKRMDARREMGRIVSFWAACRRRFEGQPEDEVSIVQESA